jgi:hypothetical protein
VISQVKRAASDIANPILSSARKPRSGAGTQQRRSTPDGVLQANEGRGPHSPYPRAGRHAVHPGTHLAGQGRYRPCLSGSRMRPRRHGFRPARGSRRRIPGHGLKGMPPLLRWKGRGVVLSSAGRHIGARCAPGHRVTVTWRTRPSAVEYIRPRDALLDPRPGRQPTDGNLPRCPTLLPSLPSPPRSA